MVLCLSQTPPYYAHQLLNFTRKSRKKIIYILLVVLYLCVKSHLEIHYIQGATKKTEFSHIYTLKTVIIFLSFFG